MASTAKNRKPRTTIPPAERYCRIHVLLSTNEVVSFDRLKKETEAEQAQLYRDLKHMRKELGAPIKETAGKGNYCYDPPGFTLPQCSQRVAYDESFAAVEPLIERLNDNSLLGHGLNFLFSQVKEKRKEEKASKIRQRVRVVSHAEHQRVYDQARQFFPVIGQALLGEQRKRLKIDYTAKYSGTETKGRVISPQQLVLYRGNWYLLSWCHLRDELRTFALDGISQAALLEINADDKTELLASALGNSYGFFPSKIGERKVTLKFTPERARWVSKEQWHPNQEGGFEDGYYILKFPYSDDRELIMDILRHVPEVEVESPQELRQKVAEMLAAGLKKFSDDGA